MAARLLIWSSFHWRQSSLTCTFRFSVSSLRIAIFASAIHPSMLDSSSWPSMRSWSFSKSAVAERRWKSVGYLGLSGLRSGASDHSFLSSATAWSLSYCRLYPLPMAARRAQKRSAQSVALRRLGVGMIGACRPPCKVEIISLAELLNSCLGSSTSVKVPLKSKLPLVAYLKGAWASSSEVTRACSCFLPCAASGMLLIGFSGPLALHQQNVKVLNLT